MKRKGVLIVILSALLLAGCQVKEKIVKVPVPVIRLGVWSYGNTIGSNDLSLMNRALGNLTEKKAGFRLEIFDISTSTDYRLLLSGEENSKSRADIVGMYNSQFSSLAYEGYLLELENYLTEDSEILVEASCNKDELYINGHIYGIPKPMLEVNTRGLVVSNELLKKYDFSLTEINSLADMEPLLMTIIENEAEIIPLASISGGMRLFSLNEYADIVDSGIGVRYDDSSTKIVNLYTQKEYADFIQLMYRWRKMGIIDERMNQIEELGLNLVVEGDAFASDIIIRPDEVQEYKALYGDRIEIIDFHQKPKISMLQYLWGISSSCQFPELAMKALELLYTDK